MSHSYAKTYIVIVQGTSQSNAAYTQYTDTIKYVICDSIVIVAMYMLHTLPLLHHKLHNIVIVLPLQTKDKDHKYTTTIHSTRTAHCTLHTTCCTLYTLRMLHAMYTLYLQTITVCSTLIYTLHHVAYTLWICILYALYATTYPLYYMLHTIICWTLHATATLQAGDYTVYLTLYDVYTHYTLHNNDATGASVITIVML